MGAAENLTMCHGCGRMHARAVARRCATCGGALEHARARTRSCVRVLATTASRRRGRLRREPYAPAPINHASA